VVVVVRSGYTGTAEQGGEERMVASDSSDSQALSDGEEFPLAGEEPPGSNHDTETTSSPSLRKIDGIVMACVASCFVVLAFHIDWSHEKPVMAYTCVLVFVLVWGRYYIAWWATEDTSRRWSTLLLWRNVGVLFWFGHLLLALVLGEEIAPQAHVRLSGNNEAVFVCFTLAGFLTGVEPGSVGTKARSACIICTICFARLVWLANVLLTMGGVPLAPVSPAAVHASGPVALAHFVRSRALALSAAGPAPELLVGGVKNLILAPLVGAIVGIVTRLKLDEHVIAETASKTELRWLRDHAARLEATRQKTLAEEFSTSMRYSPHPAPFSFFGRRTWEGSSPTRENRNAQTTQQPTTHVKDVGGDVGGPSAHYDLRQRRRAGDR
jgi:hypothetical protein